MPAGGDTVRTGQRRSGRVACGSSGSAWHRHAVGRSHRGRRSERRARQCPQRGTAPLDRQQGDPSVAQRPCSVLPHSSGLAELDADDVAPLPGMLRPHRRRCWAGWRSNCCRAVLFSGGTAHSQPERPKPLCRSGYRGLACSAGHASRVATLRDACSCPGAPLPTYRATAHVNGHIMTCYVRPSPATLPVHAGRQTRIGLHQLFRHEWRQRTCAHWRLHCSRAEALWPGKGWRACVVCFWPRSSCPRCLILTAGPVHA
jgi:hypothetical protein